MSSVERVAIEWNLAVFEPHSVNLVRRPDLANGQASVPALPLRDQVREWGVGPVRRTRWTECLDTPVLREGIEDVVPASLVRPQKNSASTRYVSMALWSMSLTSRPLASQYSR